MADSPVLFVYYRPDNDDAYPGVPNRHITEADWARFSPSQRRTVEQATTQEGYTRRKVWVHRDLVDETEQERAEREAAEQAARDAYERGQSLVRYREFEKVLPGPGEVIVGSASGPVAVHRAMAPPAPMTARLLPYPTVMASPPTVTVTDTEPMTGTVTTIPGDHPAIRYTGAIPDVNAAGAVSSKGLSSGRMPFTAEFMFDGAAFSLRMYPQRAQVRLRVDGELVTPGFDTTYSSATGSRVYIGVTFGSRAVRRITVEMNDLAVLMSVQTDPRDTIWLPETPVGPTVVVIGASWSAENATAVRMAETFPYIMGEALGWRDVRSSSISGTGYLHGATYRSRLTTDVFPHDPDLILVTGSGNDAAYSAAAITEEAGLLYDAIRGGAPHAGLIVVEPFYRATPSAITHVQDAIRDAAQARTLPFISTRDWFTGTGQVESPTSDGNGNYYITGNHPNRAGSAYLGRRLASAVAALADGLV